MIQSIPQCLRMTENSFHKENAKLREIKINLKENNYLQKVMILVMHINPVMIYKEAAISTVMVFQKKTLNKQ